MLLDTHALLWVLQGGERLGPRARAAIEAGGDVRFSAVSVAENRIKQALGKLTVPADIISRIGAAGLRELSFTAAAAERLLDWPTLVRHDPFDRLLLAQAVAAGVPLMTADRVLLELPAAPVIDARS